MNLQKAFLLALAFLILPASHGQQLEDAWLEAVEIYGIPLKKYAAGSEVKTLDSAALATLPAGSLSDLLMQETGLYLKEYGHGMASTISFRGTGASHTAVLWNGLNLNSLTLGSSDFSGISVFLFDELNVHYGAASALYGTDALGGSIVMRTAPRWIKGVEGEAVQVVGSFGEYFTGAKARYGNGKWEGHTAVYHDILENNFPFENTAKFGAPVERQQNAAIHQYGVLQEVAYKFAANRYLALKAWHHVSDNEIMPVMSANFRPGNYEQLENENTRVVLDYHQNDNWGYFNGMAGFVRDHQVYSGGNPISTIRFISRAEWERGLGNNLTAKLGADWRYIRPDVARYETGITQHRQDLHASLRWEPLPQLLLSAAVRQAFVTGFTAPFSPSVGAEWHLTQQENSQLTWKAAAARSYRVPTFNDLYWQPGGNPDLKPEQGWNVESGFRYQFDNNSWKWSATATAYRMWVTDWIVWMDGGSFWTPQNIREVDAAGIELDGRLERQTSWGNWAAWGQYALTSAKNRFGLSDFDRSGGKQLPYTPEHRATLGSELQWKGWLLRGMGQYTGKRYLTSTNESALPGFFRADMMLGKGFQWRKLPMHISVRANNIFDADYQNMANRAMPGRHYQMILRVQFQKHPHKTKR